MTPTRPKPPRPTRLTRPKPLMLTRTLRPTKPLRSLMPLRPMRPTRLIWPLIPKKSNSALLISPSEFDATINFEDLSQKIAGTAFAPSETVIGTARAPSKFRITIESTTNLWRSLILMMRPMGPMLLRPTRALWPKRSLSFAIAAVVDIAPSWFLFSSFCLTMPLPFTPSQNILQSLQKWKDISE